MYNAYPHLSSNHRTRIYSMDHAAPSSTFQSLFDVALQDYERQTGTRLFDYPLAKQLEVCDSLESITAFLQERACAFREFRGEDGRIMKSLKRVTHVLYTLSTNAVLGEGIGVVRYKLSWEFYVHSLRLNSHSHPRKQYSPVLPSYLLSVPFSTIYGLFESSKSLSGRPSKTSVRVTTP